MRSIAKKLTEWYGNNARDLPCAGTRDAYAIWISEIMLQQTQVKTVIPYFERWMRIFPTVGAFARAPLETVLKQWEGLGYYKRVRNAQTAACQILERHGGRFPAAFEDVLALPGVGRYTAGAICSLAFNQPAPILDGNVIRVLSRLFGISGNPRDKRVNQKLWSLAQALVSVRRHRAFAIKPGPHGIGRVDLPAAPGQMLGMPRERAMPGAGRPSCGRTSRAGFARARAPAAFYRPRRAAAWAIPGTATSDRGSERRFVGIPQRGNPVKNEGPCRLCRAFFHRAGGPHLSRPPLHHQLTDFARGFPRHPFCSN